MSNFSGFVVAATQLGLESVLIKPKRGIFSPTLANGTKLQDIVAQVTVEEVHHDRIEITHHPVEQGASISDHAFKLPAEVILRLGWSNSPANNMSLADSALAAAASISPAINSIANVAGLAVGIQGALSGNDPSQVNAIYQQLLQMQASFALFTLYTGKRKYDNMVCKVLSTETNPKMANDLQITMHCEQIILVNTQTVMLPKNVQKSPEKTASQVDKGTVSVQASSGPK